MAGDYIINIDTIIVRGVDWRMKSTEFEKVWNEYTTGKLKKNVDKKKAFKDWKRVGAISIWLLKDFLKYIKDPYDTKQIGIYISKKGKFKGKLAPIHCNGYLLAPIHPKKDKDSIERCLIDEGIKND